MYKRNRMNGCRRFSTLSFFLVGVACTGVLRAEIVLDNGSARRIGNWTPVVSASAHGGSALRAPRGAGGSTAAYRPVLDAEGIYEVFIWWPDGDASRGSNVPVFIEAADHPRNIRVDLRNSGGQWNSIGEYRLSAGTRSGVVITDMGDGDTIADAVKFVWRSPAPPPGATYCVAPWGSDAGPGTFEQPWATVQEAARTMQPGDIVHIRGGGYTGEVIPAHSGSAHRYISYRAYPGETPVLRGGGANGFTLTGLSWIRIEGITVSGFSENGILAGAGAHDLEILDCVFEGNCASTPWAAGFMALRDTSEIHLEGCSARDNAGFGFASDGTPRVRHLTLSSCVSYRNGNDGFGFYADRAYVRGCISHGNGWNLADNGDGFDFLHSTDVIFDRCTAWGSDAAPFKVGAGYNVFTNCIGADTQAVGYGRYFGITLGVAARGTVYNCSVRGVCLMGDGPYLVKNNIIRKNGASSAISVALYCGSPSVSLDSDRNLFLPDVRYGVSFTPLVHTGPDVGGTDYASLAEWQATGQDTHSSSSVASPFVDERVPALDFRLKAGCAAIDAGTSDGAPAGDFLGCGRWDDPSMENTGAGARVFVDLGACEYLTAEADTDGDGIPDYDEIAYVGAALPCLSDADLDPMDPDTDGDGVSDLIERTCPGGDPLLDTVVPRAFCVIFQPADASRVPGYVPGSGLPFAAARGHGWL